MFVPGPVQLPASDKTVGADGEELQAAIAKATAAATTAIEDLVITLTNDI
jgi:hypothetical protein